VRPETALFLFSLTDTMARPWLDAGYRCYCVDIQHPTGFNWDGNLCRVGIDIREFRLSMLGQDLDRLCFGFGFTPCTHTAVSGARWFRGKGLRKLAEAVELFACTAEILEEAGVPYGIENPASTISTYWRKPDYSFQPWNYGDMWTKPTYIWASKDFKMPPFVYTEMPAEVDTKKIWYASPGPDRANFRSETPPNFAACTFQANAPHLELACA